MTTLDVFQTITDPLSFAAGDTIFRAGDPGDAMFVVTEGEIDILVHGKLLETVKAPGGIIGEMALIDTKPRSATALAKTPGKMVRVDQQRFLFLVQNTPFFAIEVMQVIVDRLRRMDAVL